VRVRVDEPALRLFLDGPAVPDNPKRLFLHAPAAPKHTCGDLTPFRFT
jgi:hypothetical protein